MKRLALGLSVLIFSLGLFAQARYVTVNYHIQMLSGISPSMVNGTATVVRPPDTDPAYTTTPISGRWNAGTGMLSWVLPVGAYIRFSVPITQLQWTYLIPDTDPLDLNAAIPVLPPPTPSWTSLFEPAIAAGTTAQYWRGDKTWQTLNTAVVPESGNLYWTQARFDTAFGAAQVADSTHTGLLSSTDWTTFNGKQPAGSYLVSEYDPRLPVPLDPSDNGKVLTASALNAVWTTPPWLTAESDPRLPVPANPGDDGKYLRANAGAASWQTVSAATPTLAQVTAAGATTSTATTLPLTDKGGQWYNAKAYGCACDGTTDDTTAFNALLQTVYTAGGGTIYVPGVCRIDGQLVIPNDGTSVPSQPALRITGNGPSANGVWTTLPASPSALDLRYNDSVAKIDTRGKGVLEIDHITLKDGGSDSAAFIHTTNTSLKIHDVAFSGTASGVSAVNDGIILGGDATFPSTGLSTSPFQGYGTVIRDNFFDKMRHCVIFHRSANAVQVVDNTISASCGSSVADGAPLMIGVTGTGALGNYIAGNLFEVANYPYGINCGGNQNCFVGNSFWDPGAGTLGIYHFTGDGQIVIGNNEDAPGGDKAKIFNGANSGNRVVFSTSNNQAYNYLKALSVPQVTLTAATGTAPLVVSSTTPVSNLSIGGNAATSSDGLTSASGTAPLTLTLNSKALTGSVDLSAYAPLASPALTGGVTITNGTGTSTAPLTVQGYTGQVWATGLPMILFKDPTGTAKAGFTLNSSGYIVAASAAGTSTSQILAKGFLAGDESTGKVDINYNFAGLTVRSGDPYGFSSSSTNIVAQTIDTRISRASAGVVQVGTTANNALGTIKAAAADIPSVPTISSGTSAPATTPGKVGDIYVDTSAHKLYFADGTTNSSNWVIAN